MSDIEQRLRDAFDSGSVPEKNIALRNAADTIARLRAENEALHRLVKGWFDWHRFATADEDNEYLNGKGWDDAEALAEMSRKYSRAALEGDG